MRKKLTRLGYVLLVLVGLGITVHIFWLKAGQGPSRYLGRSAALDIPISGMKQVYSISNRTLVGDSVKDVTYLHEDGNIYTQEVINFSVLEGSILWKKYGEGGTFIRRRFISRIGIETIELELPEDFGEMAGVQVGSVLNKVTCEDTEYLVETSEHVKYLSYFPKQDDGTVNHNQLITKEYYDGMVDRNFEGWAIVRPK